MYCANLIEMQRLVIHPRVLRFLHPNLYLLFQQHNVIICIMDTLDGSNWDVLIAGTGIQQSLLAL